jgi:hypothetical protein
MVSPLQHPIMLEKIGGWRALCNSVDVRKDWGHKPYPVQPYKSVGISPNEYYKQTNYNKSGLKPTLDRKHNLANPLTSEKTDFF